MAFQSDLFHLDSWPFLVGGSYGWTVKLVQDGEAMQVDEDGPRLVAAVQVG